MQQKLNKQKLQNEHFDQIAHLINDLTKHDPATLERLFDYKMRENQDFEEQVEEVVKEHRIGKLDPHSSTTKYQMQMAFKKQKQFQTSQRMNRIQKVDFHHN